jgi:hypothetical protein
MASRQQRDAIALEPLRRLHTPVGWALIALTLGVLARGTWRKQLASVALRFVAFVVLAWLWNAVLSANLSGVYDRYESRLVWLFALALTPWLKARAPSRAAAPLRRHVAGASAADERAG